MSEEPKKTTAAPKRKLTPLRTDRLDYEGAIDNTVSATLNTVDDATETVTDKFNDGVAGAKRLNEQYIQGKLSKTTDEWAAGLENITKHKVRGPLGIGEHEESYIEKDTARKIIPFLAGGAAAAIGYALLEPINWASEKVFGLAKTIVTGGGYLSKIPIIGKVFELLGDLMEGIGKVAGYGVVALAGFIGYSMFDSKTQSAGKAGKDPTLADAAKVGAETAPPVLASDLLKKANDAEIQRAKAAKAAAEAKIEAEKIAAEKASAAPKTTTRVTVKDGTTVVETGPDLHSTPPTGSNTQGTGTGTNAQGTGTGTNAQGTGTGTNAQGTGAGTNAQGTGTGTNAQGTGTGTNTQGTGTGTQGTTGQGTGQGTGTTKITVGNNGVVVEQPTAPPVGQPPGATPQGGTPAPTPAPTPTGTPAAKTPAYTKTVNVGGNTLGAFFSGLLAYVGVKNYQQGVQENNETLKKAGAAEVAEGGVGLKLAQEGLKKTLTSVPAAEAGVIAKWLGPTASGWLAKALGPIGLATTQVVDYAKEQDSEMKVAQGVKGTLVTLAGSTVMLADIPLAAGGVLAGGGAIAGAAAVAVPAAIVAGIAIIGWEGVEIYRANKEIDNINSDLKANFEKQLKDVRSMHGNMLVFLDDADLLAKHGIKKGDFLKKTAHFAQWEKENPKGDYLNDTSGIPAWAIDLSNVEMNEKLRAAIKDKMDNMPRSIGDRITGWFTETDYTLNQNRLASAMAFLDLGASARKKEMGAHEMAPAEPKTASVDLEERKKRLEGQQNLMASVQEKKSASPAPIDVATPTLPRGQGMLEDKATSLA